MNEERTDILVQELISLDPSLASHEVELRVLMSEMLREKPEVHISDAFRTSLRARILTGKGGAVLSPYATFSWWAARLVPVGAVALLLIMLVPGDILHAPEALEESSVATDMADEDMGDARILDVPSSGSDDAVPSQYYGMGGGGSGPMAKDSVAIESTMSMKAVSYSPPPFTIEPQNPGPKVTVASVSIGVTSFIAVYTYLPDGREEVVGVSPLIMPGTTTDVPIYLRAPTHVGQSYTAILHIDNGNRVFTYGEDMPALDEFGNPYSFGFEIVSGYFE